jgi:tetratricopeptide (TPR) repeat protein
MKVGRNDPCPCGSGKKYKHCCGVVQTGGTAAMQSPGWTRAPSKAPTDHEQNQLIALYQAGRYAELESRANLFVRQYPDSGFGWKILSAALAMQGKDAFHALEQAARLLPQDAEVHNNLGDLLAKQERLEEAAACFHRALQLKPRYADACFNFGQVMFRLCKYAEADAYLRKAIELRPGDADAYNNLANNLVMQERYAEADTVIRRALVLKPDSPKAHCVSGMVLRAQRRYAEAEMSYRKALEFDPDYAEANCGLGGELMERGDFVEAEMHYRRALTADPDYIRPLYALVSAKKVKQGDVDFEALKNIEERVKHHKKSLSLTDSMYMHFGLGKCFDDAGEYDAAFPHFLTACQQKRATFAYDAESDTQVLDEVMRILDRTRIDSLRGSGDPSDAPIFVVGMPRSGTTLTEQIIASHPSVYGAGELTDLLAITHRSIAGIAYPGSLRLLDQKMLAAWGREYISAIRRLAPSVRHITDKLPQNFLSVGLIHLMLPNAKIVHIKRDPVDTCISCFTNLFANNNIKYSYDLVELGKFYVNYVRMMEYWRSVLPNDAVLDVQYEDLVSEPEAQVRRLIAYCGLEWDDACLDFHKTDRSVRTASVAQVRRPIYRSSMERWRRYERHLGPLLDVLGDIVPNR